MDTMRITDLGSGLKGINFEAWGGIDNFLMATSSGAGGTAKPMLLKRVVPWLAKANNMTANAVASLPFDILKENGDIYDTSLDWQNNLGGMPAPSKLIWNLASSLCGGKAYIIPTTTNKGIADLHYCAPHTCVPLITTTGLVSLSRTSDWGAAGRYYPAGLDETDERRKSGPSGEMMYFWLPDSDIEIGPAKTHPMSTALTSSELLADMDQTLKTYAERGFVPPTILAAKGMPKGGEVQKAENWWNSFLRGWSNTVGKILNAEALDVKQVGAGFEAMRTVYRDLTKQQIENIGAAHGIPAALFMSDMSFASEVNPIVKIWYSTSEFVSIYQCIQDTFNEQLFNRYGLHMVFKPETLDAFQEDEMKRANAFREYVSARIRPSIVANWLGIDMPEVNGVKLEYSALDEDFNRSLVDKPVAPTNDPGLPPDQTPLPAPTSGYSQTGFGGKSVALDASQINELHLWCEIAQRDIRKGKIRAFQTKTLPEWMAESIRCKLKTAANELDVLKAFDISGADQLTNLVEAIRLEVEAIDK